jgi:hypothetical protein
MEVEGEERRERIAGREVRKGGRAAKGRLGPPHPSSMISGFLPPLH